MLATALPLAAQDQDSAKPPFHPPTRIGTLPKKTIPEASGIARSRRYADIYWTHNDSGGKAEVFAVHQNGTLVRRVPIPGATNVDWEDIALDSKNRLVAADLGDNFLMHREHTLYRFAEPDPAGSAAVPDVEVFRFAYPAGQGPVDAEALFLCDDWAFVLTKEKKYARLFRIPLTKTSAPGQPLIAAELVGKVTDIAHVTAASLSDDGRHLAILTYLEVVVLDLDKALQPQLAPTELLPTLLAAQRREQRVFLGQCEGITWDGPDLVVATEQGPFTWGEPLLWRLAANAPKQAQAEGMK
jgi:hypothetical protein